MIAIPKNTREEIRVSVDDYRGIPLANIRVWYLDGTEYRPGKQGIAIRRELVPQLIDALQRIGAP
jgi:hypothetical protein